MTKTAKPRKAAPEKKAAADTPAKRAATAIRAKREGEGRPTKWIDGNADLAFQYCLLGATDKRLAELFDVNVDTIDQWKRDHREFSESICNGREKADALIAESLYHRAKGYSHKEDDIRAVAGEIVITPTIKHYPPDTQAASLWLRNRQPKLWRDKMDVALGGSEDMPPISFEEAGRRVAFTLLMASQEEKGK